jgi:hypothetical protein
LIERADDARLDAAAMSDPQAKRMTLVLAAGYKAHAIYLERSGLPHEGARTDFQLRVPRHGRWRHHPRKHDLPRDRLAEAINLPEVGHS